MHRGATRPEPYRGLARLMLALAVVFGLAGMHGLGESAVFGCHAPVSVPAGPQPGSVGEAHAGALGPHDASSHRVDHQHSAVLSHDGVCQPLQPDWLAWLPVLACVALLPLALLFCLDTLLWRTRTRLHSWWRASPRAGRVCLVRVCVSRT